MSRAKALEELIEILSKSPKALDMESLMGGEGEGKEPKEGALEIEIEAEPKDGEEQDEEEDKKPKFLK